MMKKLIVPLLFLTLFNPFSASAAMQVLGTKANTAPGHLDADANFVKQNANNAELQTTKADKDKVVRVWADFPDGGDAISTGTPVWYDGKLYNTIQAFVKTSGATPDTFTEYFEVASGSGISSSGGISHATSDGNYYASRDGDWANLAGVFLTSTGSAAGLTNFPTFNQSTTGNAATATALATNPTDCTTGQYATTIAANGNLTCGQVAYSQVAGTPTVSDTAYGVGWNGDTGAASKNAIYDKIETIAGGSMTYPGVGLPVSTGTAWGTSLAVATTVGETGADTSIPTEQAVREAITALPGIAFGTGLSVAANTPSAGTDTVSVTTNTYQAYDADLTTWAGVTPGTSVVASIATATGAVGGLPTIIAKGAYTVDTASIAANSCNSSVAVTATGVATTDVVIATPNSILSTIAGFGVTTAGAVRVDIYPTFGNVNFQFCNPTSAAIDPGSVTFNWKVLR